MRYPTEQHFRVRHLMGDEWKTIPFKEAMEADLIYLDDGKIVSNDPSDTLVEAWTGSVDRNYKKVYEGDDVILFDALPIGGTDMKAADQTGFVVYDDEEARFVVYNWNDDLDYPLFGEMEVIDG